MNQLICSVFLSCILMSTYAADIEMFSAWYNFKTRKTEYFSDAPPDNRLKEFISQDPAAQGLYAVYRLQGHSERESAIMVLSDQLEAWTDEPVPHKEHKH